MILTSRLKTARFTGRSFFPSLALSIAGALAVILLPPPAQAAPREQIRIVGSSTMYNMTSEVAERFGKQNTYPAPVVRSTGTGGGFKQFCAGIGDNTPDVVAASRHITDEEKAQCQKNDAGPILELYVGTGGLVLVNQRDKGPYFNLTRAHIWQALAAEVPVHGTLQKNPYQNWHEIDPTLPDLPILVYGPPLTSGTRDALVGMVIEPVCLTSATISALANEKEQQTVCMKLREDGAYIDAGEYDDNLLRRVAANPKAIAIIGFHALDDSPELKAAPIDGIQPTTVSLMNGSYPLIRDLLLYVKADHLDRIPGLADFVRLYVSDPMIGPQGLLTEDGMISLPDGQRKKSQDTANGLKGKSW